MKSLSEKIISKQATVGVVGLGYVGLPLVLEFVERGFEVIGFDIDLAKCDSLRAGQSYIKHIPGTRVAKAVESGRLQATTDFKKIHETDAVIICVPTPLTKQREPDMTYIETTAKMIGPYLKKDHLVSLESTTYPGTTTQVLQPILEGLSGLKAGQNLHLAFSPEREDPANPNFTTRTIPKVVGGIDAASLAVATSLYQQVVERVVPVSSTEAAESTKLLENIYRAVNIALVNELKMVFDRMGINVWEVIQAASTKPFGYTAFYPGPGLGGHCIPIDPFYLTWKAREFDIATKFVELAGEINSEMPSYVVSRTQEALNSEKLATNGSKILLLGLAYKKNVDDYRESPALKLIELYEALGAQVDYHDPFVPELPKNRHYPKLAGRKSVPWTTQQLSSYNCVVIVTDHDSVDYKKLQEFKGLVVDTRNALASRNIQVQKKFIA